MKLLTVGEVAEALRLDPETVRVMLRKGQAKPGPGRLRGRKIGREWRVHPRDLDKFWNECAVEGVTDE